MQARVIWMVVVTLCWTSLFFCFFPHQGLKVSEVDVSSQTSSLHFKEMLTAPTLC